MKGDQQQRRAKRRMAAEQRDLKETSANLRFFKVASAAWNYFEGNELKAIRGLTRDCRDLHDRNTSRVTVHLGSDEDGPSPAEVTRTLARALARGTTPKSLYIKMTHVEEEAQTAVRERQVLAVLSACANPELKRIGLCGSAHFTDAIASAVASAAPVSLLVDDQAPMLPAFDRDVAAVALMKLLWACVPRLEELELIGMGRWPSIVLQTLQAGTSLTILEISFNAGWDEPYLPGEVASAVRVVAGLRQLHTLRLTRGRPAEVPEDLETCDLQCLSSLTGLTELRLDLPGLSQEPYSQHYATQVPMYRHEWDAVWHKHRAGLAAALRCMPGLEELRSSMYMDVRELAGLAALTSLALSGVLLPPAGGMAQAADPWAGGAPGGMVGGGVAAGAAPAAGGVGPTVQCWSMPPRLTRFRIRDASPSMLGALRAPACLSYVGIRQATPTILLHHLDCDVDAAAHVPPPRLRPSALAAFAAAVELLKSGGATDGSDRLKVVSDTGNNLPLHPPQPAAALQDVVAVVAAQALGAAAAAGVEGPPALAAGVAGVALAVAEEGAAAAAPAAEGSHAAWLAALAPLRPKALELENILLDELCVASMAQHLPGLTSLELTGCSALTGRALPILATLPKLESLSFSFAHCIIPTRSPVVSQLVQRVVELVQQPSSLTNITMRCAGPFIPTLAVFGHVRESLQIEVRND